ncbi:CDGSH iron-sulfur domain-containing protein [Streptomyces sp. NPDC006339]|uniref:CDGSH iron-sulfur domain-containing protein n=1 Tax=Streptomyces sp. NPDC006339 TaxID=3156755 RepID=UPI00339F4E59
MSLSDERVSDERATNGGAARPRPAAARVTPVPDGPLLVEGPVEIVLDDGTVRRCDRPVIALCMCRRSLRAPFCDTSHRPRLRRGARDTTRRDTAADDGDGHDGHEGHDTHEGHGTHDGEDVPDEAVRGESVRDETVRDGAEEPR